MIPYYKQMYVQLFGLTMGRNLRAMRLKKLVDLRINELFKTRL